MKRGQAQVISVVLITLLVISAVSILGFSIYKFVNKSTEKTSAGKFLVELQVREVVVVGDNLEVLVERERGKGDLFAIRFVLFNEVDSKAVAMPVTDFDEEEVQKFTLENLEGFNLDTLGKVTVTPILELESGGNVSGDFTDEYDYKAPLPDCGNGVVEGDEECDYEGSNFAGYCGDGKIQNGDICNSNCDGYIHMEEVCEYSGGRGVSCIEPIGFPICIANLDVQDDDCKYFLEGYAGEGECLESELCRGDCKTCLTLDVCENGEPPVA